MRASYLMSGVATGLRRNASMTVALVLSTAISLAFAGSALLVKREIVAFRKLYEDKINVSIYLCSGVPDVENKSPCKHKVTDAERSALQAKLSADPQLVKVSFISEAQAITIAKERIGAELVDAAGPGAIPASFTLQLKNVKRDYDAVAARYANVAGVDRVQNQDESLKVLLKMFNAAVSASLAVMILVLIAAVIQMSNTIRLAAEQRKNETGIMRLVGATRWMTQLPFIIEAVIAAVVGGILAVALVWAGKIAILDHLFRDQVANKIIAGLNGNDVIVSAGIPMLGGIVLSAVIAWVTLRLFVKI